jgi:hypothetical protein
VDVNPPEPAVDGVDSQPVQAKGPLLIPIRESWNQPPPEGQGLYALAWRNGRPEISALLGKTRFHISLRRPCYDLVTSGKIISKHPVGSRSL